MAAKRFTGSLAERLRTRAGFTLANFLDDPRRVRDAHLDEVADKLTLLFEHYRISPDDPYRLILALAMDFVPGFMPPKRRPGPKRKEISTVPKAKGRGKHQDDTLRWLIEQADTHPSDVAFIRDFLNEYARDTGRSFYAARKAEAGSLRNQISRGRKRFSIPRRVTKKKLSDS